MHTSYLRNVRKHLLIFFKVRGYTENVQNNMNTWFIHLPIIFSIPCTSDCSNFHMCQNVFACFSLEKDFIPKVVNYVYTSPGDDVVGSRIFILLLLYWFSKNYRNIWFIFPLVIYNMNKIKLSLAFILCIL